MKNKACIEATIHKKGWGYEKWIVNSELYCGKILHFERDKKCSVHFHKLKTENFYINKGQIKISWLPSWDASCYDDETNKKHWEDHKQIFILDEGDGLHIPPGTLHQIYCLSENADIVEISTQHFDTDSYRLLKGD